MLFVRATLPEKSAAPECRLDLLCREAPKTAFVGTLNSNMSLETLQPQNIGTNSAKAARAEKPTFSTRLLQATQFSSPTLKKP
jgi:hypothetical protein